MRHSCIPFPAKDMSWRHTVKIITIHEISKWLEENTIPLYIPQFPIYIAWQLQNRYWSFGSEQLSEILLVEQTCTACLNSSMHIQHWNSSAAFGSTNKYASRKSAILNQMKKKMSEWTRKLPVVLLSNTWNLDFYTIMCKNISVWPWVDDQSVLWEATDRL